MEENSEANTRSSQLSAASGVGLSGSAIGWRRRVPSRCEKLGTADTGGGRLVLASCQSLLCINNEHFKEQLRQGANPPNVLKTKGDIAADRGPEINFPFAALIWA